MIELIKIETIQHVNDISFKTDKNDISGMSDSQKFQNTLQDQVKNNTPRENDRTAKENAAKTEDALKTKQNEMQSSDKIEKERLLRDRNAKNLKNKKLNTNEREIKITKEKIKKLDTVKDLETYKKIMKTNKNSGEKINAEQMLKDIDQLINIIKNMPNKSKEMLEVQDALKGVKNSFFDLKFDQVKMMLEKTFSKLESIMKEINPKLKESYGKLSDLLAQLDSQLKKATQVSERKNSPKTDANAEVKTANSGTVNTAEPDKILSKPGMNDHFEKSTRDDSSESRLGHSLSALKNNTQAQKNDASSKLSPQNPSFKEQMDKIIENARITVRDSKNATFNLKLYPKELGSVNINLGLEKGVLNGRFLVDTQDAKNILVENLSQIRAQLEEAGIAVGDFMVSVNDSRTRLRRENEDMVSPLSKNGKDTAENKTNEYEQNTSRMHEGAINVLI